jgi:hypothetical protein
VCGLGGVQGEQETANGSGRVNFYELGKREPGWNAVMAMCGALGVDCTVFGGLLAGRGTKAGR